MAIRTTEMNSLRRMHRGFISGGVARNATQGFAIRFLLRLALERR
jgi:hypothetical protein